MIVAAGATGVRNCRPEAWQNHSHVGVSWRSAASQIACGLPRRLESAEAARGSGPAAGARVGRGHTDFAGHDGPSIPWCAPRGRSGRHAARAVR